MQPHKPAMIFRLEIGKYTHPHQKTVQWSMLYFDLSLTNDQSTVMCP